MICQDSNEFFKYKMNFKFNFIYKIFFFVPFFKKNEIRDYFY